LPRPQYLRRTPADQRRLRGEAREGQVSAAMRLETLRRLRRESLPAVSPNARLRRAVRVVRVPLHLMCWSDFWSDSGRPKAQVALAASVAEVHYRTVETVVPHLDDPLG